jgi:hypothetical protein
MKLPSEDLWAFAAWVPWHFGTATRAQLNALCALRQKLEEFNGAPLCGRFNFNLVIIRWATRYAWARELWGEGPPGLRRPSPDPELFASHYLAVIFEEFTGRNKLTRSKEGRKKAGRSTPWEQFAEACFVAVGMPVGSKPKKRQVPWKTFRRARDEFMKGGILEESTEPGAYFPAIRRDLWGDLSVFAQPGDLVPVSDDWGEIKDADRSSVSQRMRAARKGAKQTKTDAATAGVLEWWKTYTPEQREEDARSDRPTLAAAFNRYVRDRQAAGAICLGYAEWKPIYQNLAQ